jgi:hypothetical protein
MGLQKFRPPALPVPPKEYDQQYLVQLTRALSIYFSQLASQTPTIANSANWSAVPTTADTTFPNLPFNDMYRGATEDILRVRIDGLPYAPVATQAQLATKVSKSGDTMTGNLTVPSITIGAFTIQQTAGKLTFSVAGNPIGSLDTSGNFTVTGNVTGFGTP